MNVLPSFDNELVDQVDGPVKNTKPWISKKIRNHPNKRYNKRNEDSRQKNAVLSAAERVLREARGYYFESYSSLQCHEGMIRDRVRTMAYKRAIELNKHLFENKIVLDVGCGLGILSLFAASAGAKKVIGIDASDIIRYTNEVIQNSGFDNIIIKKGKVEEIKELPENIKKVDIIVSEWMGFCLYYESMLGTVLYARDKWLKKNGVLFPDFANLYLAGIDDSRRQNGGFSKWNSVYGFNFAPLLDIAFTEPLQDTVNPNQVVTSCELIRILDLHAATSDYPFTVDFALNVKQNGSIGGFVAYFDAIFSQCHKTVTLTTSPFSTPTHWRQTSFFLRDPILAQCGDEIAGTFTLDRSKHNFRDLEIRIKGKHIGQVSGKYFDAQFVMR